MIDPVSMLAGVGLLGAGWLVGRHGRLKSRPEQPKPWCMCGHHYGAHDPETDECLARIEESTYIAGTGYRDLWVTCPCVLYTGPQPVEQYWVPPAADMSIVTAPREIDR